MYTFCECDFYKITETFVFLELIYLQEEKKLFEKINYNMTRSRSKVRCKRKKEGLSFTTQHLKKLYSS